MSHFILVGLGNPGAEYENTRHNTGAMVLDVFRRSAELPDWEFDKKLNALVSEGKITPPSSSPLKRGGGRGGVSVMLISPKTFMNKSGDSLKNLQLTTHNLQQGKKKIKEVVNLAVIHDDLDIPFGSYKISFNKSSGGHRGVESIMKAIKTEAFVRIRVGISPSTPKGMLKKPKGEAAVDKHILGKFSPGELVVLKKMSKRIAEGLHCFVTENREKAMSVYNG